MSVVHLRFDEPQSSFVCTCCGKFPVVDAAIAQDAVDHHLSLYCEDCAENIGPREVAGARTATNSAMPKLPPFNKVCAAAYGGMTLDTEESLAKHACVRKAYDYIKRQLSA